MIKTLHITNAWHDSSGGIRTWYRAAIDGANRAGRQLRLVVPGSASRQEVVGECVKVYHVRAPRAPMDHRYRLLLPSRYMLPAGALARILDVERPDLIEICDKYSLNWLAGLIRKDRFPRLGRPTLVGMSCERMDDNVAAFLGGGAEARRLAAFYCRYCYIPMFDFHLAASDYVAAELKGAMVAGHRRPVVVATPGVDAERFTPALRSEALRRHHLGLCGSDERGVLLFYGGRLSPEKNVAVLVDVVERLNATAGQAARPFCLVVAGDGPLFSRLQAEASARAAGRISLLGHVEDRTLLARLNASCDVFVHPNPREPFGIGPLEAMASGCPVVLPGSGGVLSYAHPGNAWLAANSAEGFAAAIRSASIDDQQRRVRVARARQTAMACEWPGAIRRAFDFYDAFHEEFQNRPGDDWPVEIPNRPGRSTIPPPSRALLAPPPEASRSDAVT